VVDSDSLTIRTEASWTLRPKGSNHSKPLIQQRPKSSRSRILHRAQLIGETVFPKQRDGFLAFRYKAAIAQPHEQIQDGRRTREDLDGFQIGGNGMGQNLPVELFAQDHDVLTMVQWSVAAPAAVVPDVRLAQKRESRHVNDRGRSELAVGSEENRSAENPLERADESAIVFAALLHTERVEHFRSAPESNRLTLLPDSQSCEKYGYDSIQSKRQPILRVARDLEHEVSIPAFEQQLAGRRGPDRQTAKNEWSRAESQVLVAGLPTKAHEFDAVELVKDPS
jgi:hypothetical protein